MSIRLPNMICLAATGMLLVSPVFAESIYKWIDENGQPHYSDVPREGATEIDIEPAQTFSAPRVVTNSAQTQSEQQSDTATSRYRSFAVTSPTSEETLWNIGGNLNVNLSLQPALQPGHQIRVYLDGKSRGITASTSMRLTDVYRGTHQVSAEVVDQTGRALIQAQPVSFYVKQTSVDNNPRVIPTPPVQPPDGPVTRSELPRPSRQRNLR